MIFKQGRELIALDTDVVKGLSKTNPVRSLLAILGDWLIIATAIGLSEYVKHPIAYLIVWFVIGSRMYALYSLLHEGIHYLLFPQKEINDFLCRVFLSWPLFIPLSKIRKFHLAHHQHLKTADDPESAHLAYQEFQFPMSSWKLTRVFLKDITGINFILYKVAKIGESARKLFQRVRVDEPKSFTARAEPWMLMFYIGIGFIMLYTGSGLKFICYWIVPYMTVYQALNRLRLSTEHIHVPEDKWLQTRTVNLNFAERIILSPHNLGFHTEHHLYPSVPFYHLPVLHKKLLNITSFRDHAVVNRSYIDVVKEYIH